MTENIIIAGIGGQGTVLASRLIAAAAMESGSFVRTAETIGMAQRGGSVTSHVRINSENRSSMISYGGAELLIAFDANEAVRSSVYLGEGGKALINLPSGAPKPEHTPENALFIDGQALALKCGNVKALNVVLIGAACGCGYLEYSREFMHEILKKLIPAKYIEMNLSAFDAGFGEIKI